MLRRVDICASAMSTALLVASGCAPDTPDVRAPETQFMATDSAVLWAPEQISSAFPEFAASFTPAGSTVYFNRASPDRNQLAILESRLQEGRWSEPVTASFSGTYRDVDPFVSRAGERLYFSSSRPIEESDTTPDFNTWYVERREQGWSEPVALGAPFNTESQEAFVSLDAENILYFASDRDGTQRVYRSSLDGSPEIVPFDLNLQEGASNPLINSAGTMLIFVSDREGGHGTSDLYVTCLREGQWSLALNLGPVVNSAYADFAPAFTPDERFLVFTSERPGIVPALETGERPPGDLYYVELGAIDLPCGA
jgi:Tol biopolymer transport system component